MFLPYSYVVTNYLAWRVVQHMLPFTIERMRRAEFRFDRYRYSMMEIEVVSRQCYRITTHYMRFAVGRLLYDSDKQKPMEREAKVCVRLRY